MTADQVALAEVGDYVGTRQRTDWQMMEGLRYQGVPPQLSGLFQAALESGLKSPSVIRQGNIIQVWI